MNSTIMREITPLTQHDCFMIFTRSKQNFDFPLHYHEEYELNFITGAAGAQRIVGDHQEEINDTELVLVGPNLTHGWFNHHLKNCNIHEITVQFHPDLFHPKLLRKNQLHFMSEMFDSAAQGILFSPDTTRKIMPRLLQLGQHSGFDSVLELMSILHDLSLSRNMRLLSQTRSSKPSIAHNHQMETAFEYMNNHYDRNLSVADVARHVNMSEVTFSRSVKKHTGHSFADALNEIRLGYASRLLVNTGLSISEISMQCGFGNAANFNRAFKRSKGRTPKGYREALSGSRTFI